MMAALLVVCIVTLLVVAWGLFVIGDRLQHMEVVQLPQMQRDIVAALPSSANACVFMMGNATSDPTELDSWECLTDAEVPHAGDWVALTVEGKQGSYRVTYRKLMPPSAEDELMRWYIWVVPE